MSLELDEHRHFLSDPVKLDAFRRALNAQVRPGDTVLDLASGTGILGMLACAAGAGRVYALEHTSLAGLAREIAQANRLADRITVIQQHSEWATLPEPVDVIVTDQIGRVGFDAGLYEYLIDARDRLATAGARLVPQVLELWCVPCEHAALRNVVSFWQQRTAGFDWTPAHRLARATGYPYGLNDGTLLAAPQCVARTDFRTDEGQAFGGELMFEVTRDGHIDALAGWFRAELAPGVWMNNGPEEPHINRPPALLSVQPALPVSAGDEVRTDVRVTPTSNIVSWTLETRSPNGRVRACARRSTFQGMLLSTDDLARANPQHVPRLSRAGQVRQAVLRLVDGQRTLRAVEDALYDEHRDFFRTPAAAARFVAEVLQRYGE